uniref:Uncharacterized protein n=1 Tax=Rhizophora mucronata TaxID=61149 RepID=A0A2P2JHX2_RHIMU
MNMNESDKTMCRTSIGVSNEFLCTLFVGRHLLNMMVGGCLLLLLLRDLCAMALWNSR